MSSQLKSAQNFFILCLGASLIGLAPLFVRWSELSPSWNLCYRMFLALPFLALLNFYHNGSQAFKLKSRRHLLLVLIASLAFAGDMSSWHWSLEFTSVANATIFVNTASIYMVIFAVLIFKEPISKQFILSFTLTFVGVIGLIYFSNIKTEGALLGDGIALMAAFLYATYLLIISRLGEESSINIIFYTTLFTGMFGLVFALFESRDFLPSSRH